MKSDENPLDSQTEYVIEDDRPGVPEHIDCKYCDVAFHVTEPNTPGIFTILHADDCPNAGMTPPDPEIPERLE